MRMLLIEDDQDTGQLLSATLSAQHYAVDTITDGAIGLELATRWNYDLILLDLSLPTLNGLEVCRRLRAQGCQTPILILTAEAANESVVAGLDAGADDYVVKSSDSSQLLARVRALLRRVGQASRSSVLTWGLLQLNATLAQVNYNHQLVSLRPKEYRLLELFLRHPQHILSRSNIIDHLWSIEETPVEGSVTNLIKDLRQRLRAAGMKTDLIETVYGLGYRLKSPPKAALESERSHPERHPERPRPEQSAPRGASVVEFRPRSDIRLVQDWSLEEQHGMMTIQQITERFCVSLNQRLTALETAIQLIQANESGLSHQEAARKEAHKLAGGLGTFGYDRASEIARTIEDVLAADWGVQPAQHLVQLLQDLRQELAQSSSVQPESSAAGSSSPTSRGQIMSGR